MNNKLLTIALILGLTTTSIVVPKVVPARAQNVGGIFGGNGNNSSCSSIADRDWATFLASVISYDDFVEYWKDILVRYNTNSCLYLDIDNLLQQITKVRAQVRQSFYACDARSQGLKEQYYKLEAELFFLRKYINPSKGTLLVASDQQVFNQLRDYFVINKNFLSEDDAKALFEQFKAKYANRLTAYQNCSDATWVNIIQKWNELKSNVESGFGAKSAAESINQKWEAVSNIPIKRSGDFLGGLLDARINGVTPEAAFSDILNDLKKNLPNGVSFDQVQLAQDREQARYQTDLEKADYLTQYEHLYKASSGEAVTSILGKLTTLESTITGTYPFINQTYQCTKGILDRSC